MNASDNSSNNPLLSLIPSSRFHYTKASKSSLQTLHLDSWLQGTSNNPQELPHPLTILQVIFHTWEFLYDTSHLDSFLTRIQQINLLNQIPSLYF